MVAWALAFAMTSIGSPNSLTKYVAFTAPLVRIRCHSTQRFPENKLFVNNMIEKKLGTMISKERLEKFISRYVNKALDYTGSHSQTSNN